MNYDPIHDTYTPAAGAKPGTDDLPALRQLQLETCQPKEHRLLYSPHKDGQVIPPTTTKPLEAVNAPAFAPSNLHQSPEGQAHQQDATNQASIWSLANTRFNNPEAGVGITAATGLAASLLGNKRVHPSTLDPGPIDNLSHSPVLAHNGPRSSKDLTGEHIGLSVHSHGSIASVSTQDEKFHAPKPASLSAKNCEDQGTFGDRNQAAVTSPDASDLENQRQLDSLDHSSHFDDDGPTSYAAKVPLGSLPPDFRSTQKGLKYLKKNDGEPFWRRDIQHDFLEALFSDELRVFTNYFPHSDIENAANGPKLTFAELYVRTLAESSKSSRILSERLIRDSEVGISVSKVCLLVNAGRMNTTINFVPDMRSVLRTYHLIPSLQADPNGASKPLQDTPRLKTILKAVCDGFEEYQTLFDILRAPKHKKPNTNIIKLIFLMSSFFQNIPYHYDDSQLQAPSDCNNDLKTAHGPQNNFMEFFLNERMHPKSRARRFLWLMYTYMETSFQEPELKQNPFNPSQIPPVEYISNESRQLFDQDTDFEIEYATKMYHARMLHLNEEIPPPESKRGNKLKRERSDPKRANLESLSSNGHDLNENESTNSMTLAGIPLVINHTSIPEDINSALQSQTPRGCSTSTSYAQSLVITKSSLSPDRPPRKKPTPSVGSLVDVHKKTSHLQKKWKNPIFSAKNIRKFRSNFPPCASKPNVSKLDEASMLSNINKSMESQRAKSIVAHVLRSEPNYEVRRKEISQWMYRYFQYKKSSGNGLLGMEWEDLRSDFTNGIEAYLYQKLGKEFIIQRYHGHFKEDGQDFVDLELFKRENFATSSEILPDDFAPIDIGDINESETEFAPTHDFDRANERTTYEYLLLQIVDDLVLQSLQSKVSKAEVVRFDLNSETLSFQNLQ